MNAEKLMNRYSMSPHVENGCFIERHYENKAGGRAASGQIYYYVAPGEITQFHRIDCDEYWCYTLGSPLTVCLIDEDGKLSTVKLGVDEDCEPVVYVRKGLIFASRNLSEDEGTFLSCITVPRFSPSGFEMFTKEEILGRFPAAVDFFEE